MADLTLVPVRQRITYVPPKTIVNELGDGSTLRRRKSTATVRLWEWEFEGLTKTEADTIADLWILKGLDTTLAIVSYDPREAPATEATVYFDDPVEIAQEGIAYSTSLRFREAI